MKYKHGLAFPDADQYLFDRMPEQGVWQQEALDMALVYCDHRRTAIDGGAHIGTWSLALAKEFDDVIAFEPAADTFEALWDNADTIVECRNEALGAKMGNVDMWQDARDMDRGHTGARYAVEGSQCLMVPIDVFEYADLDFLKLDLEGGEPDAIRGAMKTLTRCQPVIVFEDKGFCRRYGYPRDTTQCLLKELGAIEFASVGINKIWGWYG